MFWSYLAPPSFNKSQVLAIVEFVTNIFRRDPIHPTGLQSDHAAPLLFAKVLAADADQLEVCDIVVALGTIAGGVTPAILQFFLNFQHGDLRLLAAYSNRRHHPPMTPASRGFALVTPNTHT
jgi:hypothetical protein